MNNPTRLELEKLLSRVDITSTLNQVVRKAIDNCSLGKVLKIKFISTGYDDLNSLVVTSKGKYVVKIFRKEKDIDIITDNVKILLELDRLGVPVTRLQEASGNYLLQTQGKHQTTYLFVTEFFEGLDFTRIRPLRNDISSITTYLAKLHSLTFEVSRNYDSWGTANLVQEHEHKRFDISQKTIELTEPVVQLMRSLDFSSCRKCIIHGDLQRKHVLTDSRGKYCLLDFGCMDFNYAVIDLAIFLSHFCIDPDDYASKDEIISYVLNTYSAESSLSKKEVELIPSLISATYAAYAISTDYLMTKELDTSKQTREWYNFACKGLELFRKNVCP